MIGQRLFISLHLVEQVCKISSPARVMLFCSPYVLPSCKLEYSTLLPVSLSCLAIKLYEYRNVVRYKVYLKRSKAYTRERQRWRKHSLTHNVQPVHTLSTLHRCSFFLSPFLRRVHILKSASLHIYYY